MNNLLAAGASNSGPTAQTSVTAMVPLVRDGASLDIALIFGGSVAPGDLDVHQTQNITSVRINLGQFGLDLSGKGFSIEELKKVARSITAATDLRDPGTWFDAEKALPLR
jgi:hypothetical protein